MSEAQGPERPGGTQDRVGRLSPSVSYSSLAQLTPLITNVVLTPFLLATLGLDTFGIWALVLVLLGTLASLDGGVAASLGRFYAVSAASGDRRTTAQLFVGSLVVFTVFGAAVTALTWYAAPLVVGLADIPGALEAEATTILQSLGLLVALALAGSGSTALLQGTGRFGSLAGLTFVSSASYATVAVLTATGDQPLRGLVAATALRYVVLLVGGALLGRSHLSLRRPILPSTQLRRSFLGYATRMQVSGLTSIVGTQMDGLVIAAFLPVRFVGLYAAGYQAAAALRALPLFAFPPVLTRLSGRYEAGGLEAAVRDFRGLEQRWAPLSWAFAVVSTSAIGFGVLIWLGEDFALSGAVAAVLMVGNGVQVAVTGMRTCLVRAVGRPGLEMRYSLVGMVVNLVLTVPMALAFGVLGVVGATSISAVVGSAYFVWLCRPLVGRTAWRPNAVWAACATAGIAVTVAGELLLLLGTGWRGPLAFVAAGVPAAAGLLLAAAPVLRDHRRQSAGEFVRTQRR